MDKDCLYSAHNAVKMFMRCRIAYAYTIDTPGQAINMYLYVQDRIYLYTYRI